MLAHHLTKSHIVALADGILEHFKVGEHNREGQDVQDNDHVVLPLEFLPLEVEVGVDCWRLEKRRVEWLRANVFNQLRTPLALDNVIEFVGVEVY